MIMKRKLFVFFIVLLMSGVSVLVGCKNSNEEQSTQPPNNLGAQSTPTLMSGISGYPVLITEEAYPSNNSVGQTATYPDSSATSEEVFTTPPDPERELPAAQDNNGVIGGVLIRQITDEGFIPFDPYELILAEIVENVEGQPAFITYDEQSKRAQTFPTGVFIFQEVPPGTYGLVVNMAVAEFPVRDANGKQIFITVEPGQVIDMGQVIVQMP
ncbi:MAG: hypothetical protein D8M54_10775 [Chloroflexi bacterium]|nr:hypothetical protein [Chloroflexota bacterium]